MTRLVLSLIRIATPRTDREFVIGDTIEEFEHIDQTEGTAAARRWLRGELWRMLLAAPRRYASSRVRFKMNDGVHRRPSLRMTALGRDARDAWRGLRSGRGATVSAFIVLTLTMAAGTVTFSVVDGVALRPLPFGNPDRLVGLAVPNPIAARAVFSAPQDYFAWLEGTQAFESLAAARSVGTRQSDVNGEIESLRTVQVTANLFHTLSIAPAAGRFFGAEHEQPGGPLGVVLSHDLWVRAFRADPAIVGRRLKVGDDSREVVGVVPAGVSYPVGTTAPPELYLPYVPTPADRLVSGGRTISMQVVGRLRPGIGVEEARADASRVSPVVLEPLHALMVGPSRLWLLLALAAVGFVLLVACVNVAAVFLTRATTRVRELATREALGAPRGRLVRVLLFEGVLLATAAAVAALAASSLGLDVVRSNLPAGLARVDEIRTDIRVLAVLFTTAALCGLFFASAPAWLAGRSNLLGLMKATGGTVVGGRRRDRSLSAFLVAEVAFVCVLLVATTLVVASFIVITTTDLGFNRQNVMTFGYLRSFKHVAEADRSAAETALRNDLLDRARAVAGVTHAAFASNSTLPLAGSSVRYSITIPGVGETGGDNMLETNMVTPDYFAAMGMTFASGRTFESSDRAGAPLVMVINEAAARRFFPGVDPVGQVVTFRGPTTIVGVLRDVRFDGPEADTRPAMFTPADQETRPVGDAHAGGSLIVRAQRDARAIAPAVRAAISPALAGLEPFFGGVDPVQIRFIDDYWRDKTASRRFNASVMATFGMVAIAIGAIGIYGTMAFFVAQQVRTIGVHMALGASPSRVMRSVLRAAALRVGAGVAIGLAGAWAVSSLFTSLVFGVAPTDPMVYLTVAGVIGIVGLAAALMPALRAARLDPLVALRTE